MSSKISPFSIEWHEECLKNHELTIIREREALERANASFLRSLDSVALLRRQIARAKREGRDSFNPARYKA